MRRHEEPDWLEALAAVRRTEEAERERALARALAFRVESLAYADDDPHFLHGIVRINGVAHHLQAWEVVDAEQSAHPAMSDGYREWYEEVTTATTPGVARAVVEIPGFPGRWVVVVAP